jgi:hypothetical protein
MTSRIKIDKSVKAVNKNDSGENTTELFLGTCFNCLNTGHRASECKSNFCQTCKGFDLTPRHTSTDCPKRSKQNKWKKSNKGRGASTLKDSNENDNREKDLNKDNMRYSKRRQKSML